MKRNVRDTRGGKAGVAADWARLPDHLRQTLPGLVVEAQEELGIGRRWRLEWEGAVFDLLAHVFAPGEEDRLSPSRIGGEASREKVGDLLVEFDFKPELVWQFKNVMLELHPHGEDERQAPAERARRIRLAKGVQSFLEPAVVSDLSAVTPRLEIQMPEEKTLLLGQPLRLACRAVNAAPEECHLEERSDGFTKVAWRGSELVATPERIGPVRFWLSLVNTRTLLRSSFVELAFQCVRERGQSPVEVQARYLMDARIEEGPRPRLLLDHDEGQRDCTEVFFIPLDEQRSVALQFRGPRYSSAPQYIAMKLQKALLLDGARPPVPLRPSECQLEPRHYPKLRGAISLASQDWVITGASTGSLADGPWLEELRRRGVEVVTEPPAS